MPALPCSRFAHHLQAQAFEFGRVAVVQAQRQVFVFQLQAGMARHQAFGRLQHLAQVGGRRADQQAVGVAALRAMFDGRRQLQRRQETVQVQQAAARHQRQRAAQLAVQRGQRAGQAQRDLHRSGCAASATSVPSKSRKSAVSGVMRGRFSDCVGIRKP